MNTPTSGPSNEEQELKKFEIKQAEELQAFEKKQEDELHDFERKEHEELEAFERRERHDFKIKIDRTEYTVHQERMTGLELRNLVRPPVGPDRDLFEVVLGGSDRKIADAEEVTIRDGLRFFTAPAQINPGVG